MRRTGNRASAARQFSLSLKLSVQLLLRDRVSFLISLGFPVAASLFTLWLAGEKMFVHYNGTKSACFVLVCAAVWCGLFNSVQIIVSDRKNLRRSYAAGLRLPCYLFARAIVQALLCLAQSVPLALAFPASQWRFGAAPPTQGVLLSSAPLEYLCGLFLLMFAADSLGLFISCVVKNPQTANFIQPYVLIVQILFSGVLFPMKGGAEFVSMLMPSRWGMETLGVTSDLNRLPLEIQLSYPQIPHPPEEMFTYTREHLLRVWLILLCFSVAFIFAGNLFLGQLSHDTR